MNSIKNITENKWILCHNSIDVFHIVELTIGQSLESGQPFLEQFDTEEELEQRINQLNPDWLSDYKQQLNN